MYNCMLRTRLTCNYERALTLFQLTGEVLSQNRFEDSRAENLSGGEP